MSLPFNPLIVQKVYSLWDGHREVGQVQAADVHEALRVGQAENPKVKCAYLLRDRKEARFPVDKVYGK